MNSQNLSLMIVTFFAKVSCCHGNYMVVCELVTSQ